MIAASWTREWARFRLRHVIVVYVAASLVVHVLGSQRRAEVVGQWSLWAVELPIATALLVFLGVYIVGCRKAKHAHVPSSDDGGGSSIVGASVHHERRQKGSDED